MRHISTLHMDTATCKLYVKKNNRREFTFDGMLKIIILRDDGVDLDNNMNDKTGPK
jgi:hypothetical protein